MYTLPVVHEDRDPHLEHPLGHVLTQAPPKPPDTELGEHSTTTSDDDEVW